MSDDLMPIWLPGWGQGREAIAPVSRALGWTGDRQRIGLWSSCIEQFIETPARSVRFSTDAGASPLKEIALLATLFPHTLAIGISMGGMLAMRGVLARPERVAGLILISSTARMPGDADYPGADPRRLRAMQKRIGRSPLRVLGDFRRAAFEPFVAPPDESETREPTEEEGIILRWGLEYLATEDLRPDLMRLEIPTLVIHGEEDRIIPVAAARWLADHLPHARLALLPGQGHALTQTAPNRVAALLAEFLGEIERG